MALVLSDIGMNEVDDIRSNGCPENGRQFESDARRLTLFVVNSDQRPECC